MLGASILQLEMCPSRLWNVYQLGTKAMPEDEISMREREKGRRGKRERRKEEPVKETEGIGGKPREKAFQDGGSECPMLQGN